MAIGKGSGSNFPPGTKVSFVKIRVKNLPAPIFEVAERQGDEYVIVDPAATHVSGNIIGINHKETPNPKKPGTTVKSVNLTIQDKNEVYFVGVPYSYLGRNILSSLLNLKTFNGIEISLYKSKPKADSKNKEGFDSAAVRQNGELIYGRFKREELPEIKKVKVGDEVHSDATAINAFFKAHVDELSKVIKAKTPEVSGEPSHSESTPTTPTAGEPDDENIPF
jgi:hypothetical protein